jgi:hypothetical protein
MGILLVSRYALTLVGTRPAVHHPERRERGRLRLSTNKLFDAIGIAPMQRYTIRF